MQIVLIKTIVFKNDRYSVSKSSKRGVVFKNDRFSENETIVFENETIVLKTINTAAAARRFRSNKKSIYKNININILKVAKMLIKIY